MADSIGAVLTPSVSIEADWQGMGEGSRRTMLHCAGGLGQDAALFCTCVGGFLPMPANRERSLSPPSM